MEIDAAPLVAAALVDGADRQFQLGREQVAAGMDRLPHLPAETLRHGTPHQRPGTIEQKRLFLLLGNGHVGIDLKQPVRIGGKLRQSDFGPLVVVEAAEPHRSDHGFHSVQGGDLIPVGGGQGIEKGDLVPDHEPQGGVRGLGRTGQLVEHRHQGGQQENRCPDAAGRQQGPELVPEQIRGEKSEKFHVRTRHSSLARISHPGAEDVPNLILS